MNHKSTSTGSRCLLGLAPIAMVFETMQKWSFCPINHSKMYNHDSYNLTCIEQCLLNLVKCIIFQLDLCAQYFVTPVAYSWPIYSCKVRKSDKNNAFVNAIIYKHYSY